MHSRSDWIPGLQCLLQDVRTDVARRSGDLQVDADTISPFRLRLHRRSEEKMERTKTKGRLLLDIVGRLLLL